MTVKKRKLINGDPLCYSYNVDQEGILYAHVSIWAVEVPQRHFL